MGVWKLRRDLRRGRVIAKDIEGQTGAIELSSLSRMESQKRVSCTVLEFHGPRIDRQV